MEGLYVVARDIKRGDSMVESTIEGGGTKKGKEKTASGELPGSRCAYDIEQPLEHLLVVQSHCICRQSHPQH
jgi:hypothetical protein